jgi:hypothetical protein
MTTATPSTAELILQEDGAVAVLGEFAEQVKDAEVAIRQLLEHSERKTWGIRELQNAAAGDRRPTAMSMALLALVKADVLRMKHADSAVEVV